MSVLSNPALANKPLGQRTATLANLTVISARGADAAAFLHGQLTQDIQGLPDDQARLAGYCTAKGRLLATMVVWRARDDDGLRMLVRADLAAALVKRLSMFVLRARVKLAVEPDWVQGVTTTQPGDGVSVHITGAPWQCVHTTSGTWITAPGVNARSVRGWWIGAVAEASAETDAAWDSEDIATGLPWIEAATQDLFIPQTLNLDLIGGVSFTKGCYPGQEVVARSHYRGTVKRRMAGGVVAGAITSTSANIAPAADVYQREHPGEPCGRVINAARVDGVTRVLFEAPLDAVAAGGLHVGGVDGPALEPIEPLTEAPPA